MDATINQRILAIVTTTPDKVISGVPVFIAKNDEEVQNTCLLLSRILKAMAHDLENGVYILVQH